MKNVENVILKNIEQNGKLSTSDIEKIKQISEKFCLIFIEEDM